MVRCIADTKFHTVPAATDAYWHMDLSNYLTVIYGICDLLPELLNNPAKLENNYG